ARGRLAELVEAIGEDAGVRDQHDGGDAHDVAGGPAGAGGGPPAEPIEGGGEEGEGAGPPGGGGAVGGGVAGARAAGPAPGGGGGEGEEERDGGGAGDRQRELGVELARDAGDEGRGHEYRRQHQGDGDEGAAHLVHASPRGVARRQAGGDVALDVLDHDDGIV